MVRGVAVGRQFHKAVLMVLGTDTAAQRRREEADLKGPAADIEVLEDSNHHYKRLDTAPSVLAPEQLIVRLHEAQGPDTGRSEPDHGQPNGRTLVAGFCRAVGPESQAQPQHGRLQALDAG